MDSTLNQLNFLSRVSPIDVSQLDKINVITKNKSRQDVLLDGLCKEDQLYLNALTEDSDSSDGHDDDPQSEQSFGQPYSPMAVKSPELMNKRIKRLRPSYEVSLSLENISYIRPSWGISKDLKKMKRTPKQVDAKTKKKDELGTKRLTFLLVLFAIAVACLSLPPYLMSQNRAHNAKLRNKVYIDDTGRILEVYRPGKDYLDRIMRASLGESLPKDLRPNRCNCELFGKVSNRQQEDNATATSTKEPSSSECIACFDWAFRANLRLFADTLRPQKMLHGIDLQDESHCYRIKWQIYNTLISAPLIDCFLIDAAEIWHGLGDLQSPSWQLNKLDTGWTVLRSNLSFDFIMPQQQTLRDPSAMDSRLSSPESQQLVFGSWVDLSLYTSNRIFLGNIKTDFDVSIKISADTSFGYPIKTLCLRASCTDKCSRNWLRGYHFDKLRHQNNVFEYNICSASRIDSLLSRQVSGRVVAIREERNRTYAKSAVQQQQQQQLPQQQQQQQQQSARLLAPPPIPPAAPSERPYAEGVGLMERLVFTTSIEYLPILNGQTIRKYVDDIVKLDLKSSLLLLIDTRWETHVGSLRLNSALFPKAKLLLEILHNKGFKIIFTVRPYHDAIIGINSMSELVDANRLYATNVVDNGYLSGIVMTNATLSDANATLIRRKSFFELSPQLINVRLNQTSRFAYVFKCKESLEGYCTLFDMTVASNRAWMVANIRKTELLSLGADGIRLGGTHPNPFSWDDHYRQGLSELIKTLFYGEKIYTLPRWTGDFGYIELAPRPCTWAGLKSSLNSVLNLGMMGYSLVHPGSVWGDIKSRNATASLPPLARSSSQQQQQQQQQQQPVANGAADADQFEYSETESDEELAVRWIQLFTFMPILQFNNLAPLDRFGLTELVQSLVKLRRTAIVPELKRHLPYTPLISQQQQHQPAEHLLQASPSGAGASGQAQSSLQTAMPLIRPVWSNQDRRDVIIDDLFMVGPDIVVAPILNFKQRQRDIYLPGGYWRDELRQMNVRGGKWLLNYLVEINEIAWFTRDKST